MTGVDPAQLVDLLHRLGRHDLSAALTRERLAYVSRLAKATRLLGQVIDLLDEPLIETTSPLATAIRMAAAQWLEGR